MSEPSEKPQVDIYLDEGEGRNDTSIEFYIDPNHVFSISIDPFGVIDWAYLWGEHSSCGSDSLKFAMKTFNEWVGSKPTEEMKDLFEKRTRRHIALVGEFCDRIAEHDDRFKELLDRKKVHDASKFEEPEYTPYLFVTWKYKCKKDGEEFKVPKDIEDRMHEATLHHVTTNSHHPEYHSPRKDDLINKENRDKPPEEIVDATGMPDLDVAEMCADWMAMSKELGGNPKDWADKNVNVRWKFTDDQKKLIYELIKECWE